MCFSCGHELKLRAPVGFYSTESHSCHNSTPAASVRTANVEEKIGIPARQFDSTRTRRSFEHIIKILFHFISQDVRVSRARGTFVTTRLPRTTAMENCPVYSVLNAYFTSCTQKWKGNDVLSCFELFKKSIFFLQPNSASQVPGWWINKY